MPQSIPLPLWLRHGVRTILKSAVQQTSMRHNSTIGVGKSKNDTVQPLPFSTSVKTITTEDWKLILFQLLTERFDNWNFFSVSKLGRIPLFLSLTIPIACQCFIVIDHVLNAFCLGCGDFSPDVNNRIVKSFFALDIRFWTVAAIDGD